LTYLFEINESAANISLCGFADLPVGVKRRLADWAKDGTPMQIDK